MEIKAVTKIPRQRTGSGGWPDRRRAVTYGKGNKSKGCLLFLVASGSVIAAAIYEAGRFIV